MADPSTYRPAPGSIPNQPGVYRFRDEHRRVIYVGKAKNLRSRLTSYFQDLAGLHARTATMVTMSSNSITWSTAAETSLNIASRSFSWVSRRESWEKTSSVEYQPRTKRLFAVVNRSSPWAMPSLPI